MPSWIRISFQDANGPFLRYLSFLHDHVIIVMLIVIVFIFYLLCYLLFNKSFYKFFSEGTFIETVWSIVPAVLLIVLVLPSMQILYIIEDIKTPSFTFKVIAHQWYWTYVTPLLNNLSYFLNDTLFTSFDYDSMMDLDSNFPRLLGCSSSLTIPLGFTSRFLISSTDVIHSFSMPRLALKVDALPGRINQIFSLPVMRGVFFGQCSEICGSNHSFMPIILKVVDYDLYTRYSTMSLLNDVLEVDNVNI